MGGDAGEEIGGSIPPVVCIVSFSHSVGRTKNCAKVFLKGESANIDLIGTCLHKWVGESDYLCGLGRAGSCDRK